MARGCGSLAGVSRAMSILCLCLMESTCLCMVLPSVSSTTYERGPVTSAILQAIHLGDFPVKFSANTLSPTSKLRTDFDESCVRFCLYSTFWDRSEIRLSNNERGQQPMRSSAGATPVVVWEINLSVNRNLDNLS